MILVCRSLFFLYHSLHSLFLWSEWSMSGRACYLHQGLKFSLTHCVEGHRVFPYKLSYRLSNFPVVFWFAFVCSYSHKSPWQSYMATIQLSSSTLIHFVWGFYMQSMGKVVYSFLEKLRSIKLHYWLENNFCSTIVYTALFLSMNQLLTVQVVQSNSVQCAFKSIYLRHLSSDHLLLHSWCTFILFCPNVTLVPLEHLVFLLPTEQRMAVCDLQTPVIKEITIALSTDLLNVMADTVYVVNNINCLWDNCLLGTNIQFPLPFT